MSKQPRREWSIGSSSAAVLGIRGFSIAGQLATVVVLARSLSLSEFGLFAVASAAWMLARALAPLGANIAVLRLGSVDWHDGGTGAKGLLRAAELQTLLVVVPGGIVAAVVPTLWNGHSESAIVAVVVGVLWALIAPVITLLRAVNLIIVGQAIDGLGLQVVPLMVIVVLSLTQPISLSMAYGAYAIGAALTLAAAFILLWIRLRGIPQTTRPDVGAFFQLSLRLWQTQIFSALSTRAPVLLAGPLAGLAQTALVETAYKPQIVSSTIAWAIGTNASPRYARTPDLAAAMPILRFSTMATASSTAALLLAIAVGGPSLLSFMGEDYAAAYQPMLVMIGAGVLESPALAAGYFFAMAGHERISIRITFAQFATLVVGLFALLPILGAMGAALALVCASSMRTVLSLMRLHQLAKRENGVAMLEIFKKPKGDDNGRS